MDPEDAPSLDLLFCIMRDKSFESILGDATDAGEIRAVSEYVWDTMKAYYRSGKLITPEKYNEVIEAALEDTSNEALEEHASTVASLNRQLEEVVKEKDRFKALVAESSRGDRTLLDASLRKEGNTSDFMNGSSLQDDADLQLSLARLSVNPLEPMNTGDGAPNDDLNMFGYNDPEIRSPSPVQAPYEDDEPTIDPAQLRDDHPVTSPGPVEDVQSSPTAHAFNMPSFFDREVEALRKSHAEITKRNANLVETVEAKQKEINVLKSWNTGKWRKQYAHTTKQVQMIKEECLRSVMFGATSTTSESNSKKRSRSDSELTSEEDGPLDDDEDEPGISMTVVGEIPAGKRDPPPLFQPVPQSTPRSLAPLQSSSSGLKIMLPSLSSVASSTPAKGIKKPKISADDKGKGSTKRTGRPMRSAVGREDSHT